MQILRTPYNFVLIRNTFTYERKKTTDPTNPTASTITPEERTKNRLKARKKRLRHKMATCEYKYFITITRGNNGTYNDLETPYIDYFLKKLIAQKNAYICVPELQKNGEEHYHIVTEREPEGFTSKVFDMFRKKMVTYSKTVNEEFGRNEVKEMDSFFTIGYFNTIKYVSKYITKQDLKIRYSRNLSPKLDVSKILSIDKFQGVFDKECSVKILDGKNYLEYFFIDTKKVEGASIMHQGLEKRDCKWNIILSSELSVHATRTMEEPKTIKPSACTEQLNFLDLLSIRDRMRVDSRR